MWQGGLKLHRGNSHQVGRHGKCQDMCLSEKSFHLTAFPNMHYIQRSRLYSFPLQSHHPDRVSSYSFLLAWHGPDLLPSQEERERHHLPRQDVGEKPDILLRPARSEISPHQLHLFSRRRPGLGALREEPRRARDKCGFCQGWVSQPTTVPKLPGLTSDALHRLAKSTSPASSPRSAPPTPPRVD